MIPIEHIHPMLVHFPIVLFMSVLALDFVIVASGRDLADHGPLAGLALVILWLGVAATLLVFAGIAVLRLFAWWRRIPVRGGRGWLAASVTLAGVAVLVLTAYRGGELVYQLGVNVAAIKP